ncbi:hypothetical protein PITC_046610 [Penicillium italicum]|uniref:Uncharacterized protein n=1 Tax=Penicillium italicum TaxID=40296 RepID=A0A0A2KV40_PENIT|nr:hypothetical protein PITC_046610 [Penicillium italicum]
MRRYQQHTHASWHHINAAKFDCPWCQPTHRAETPQNRNHSRKQSVKGSDNGRTSRASATSTPVGRRIAHESSDIPIEDQAANTPLEPPTPDSALDAINEETPEPELESDHGRYNMGRTAGPDELNNTADTLRPPLPEEWTKETEDREHSAAERTPPAEEDWRSGLATTGEVRILGDEIVGSSELDVKELKELEESGEKLG